MNLFNGFMGGWEKEFKKVYCLFFVKINFCNRQQQGKKLTGATLLKI